MSALYSSLVSSIAVPATSQSPQTISQSPGLRAGTGVVCLLNPPGRWSVFPHQKNCAAAMRDFPSNPDIVAFQGADFRRHTDCEMLLEVQGQNPVRSSWLEIGMAAMQLNMACLDSETGTAGGTTMVASGQIKITLKGYQRPRVGKIRQAWPSMVLEARFCGMRLMV